jgi:hypothetical protein
VLVLACFAIACIPVTTFLVSRLARDQHASTLELIREIATVGGTPIDIYKQQLDVKQAQIEQEREKTAAAQGQKRLQRALGSVPSIQNPEHS